MCYSILIKLSGEEGAGVLATWRIDQWVGA